MLETQTRVNVFQGKIAPYNLRHYQILQKTIFSKFLGCRTFKINYDAKAKQKLNLLGRPLEASHDRVLDFVEVLHSLGAVHQ